MTLRPLAMSLLPALPGAALAPPATPAATDSPPRTPTLPLPRLGSARPGLTRPRSPAASPCAA
jgi:hypothetical protein